MNEMPSVEPTDDRISRIIEALTTRFNRIPIEDEVLAFIYGDDTDRTNIWNKEK